jgi:putative oxidoreductase
VGHQWLVMIPRSLLGFIFSAAAINYFWEVTFGQVLIPMPIADQAKRFAGDVMDAGYLWPLMKLVNLTSGIMLISNQAPALALALLAPVTVVIVWFQLILNPLPLPLATTAVVVICELLLFRAYANCYIGLLSMCN